MSQKETRNQRIRADLLRITDCFNPFKQICRVKEIVEKTKFSRKKVWKLLKDVQTKNPIGKTAIQQVRKGVYKAIYPQFDELRRALGGEEKKFTIDELIELFKGKDNLGFEGSNKSAVLWLGFVPAFTDWTKEQDMLNLAKNKIYEASKNRNPDKLFKANQILGYIYWEETEEEEKARFLKKLELL